MTLTIVNAAEEDFLDLILAVNYTLRLFKNDATVSDTLVASGLTEADFTGYTAITLTGGSWVTTPGDPCTGAYAQQTFTASAAVSPAQSIYGYYVTNGAGDLQWLEKFGSAAVVQFSGDNIKVTPQITLADTTD